jgi:hypothetical protein
VVSPAPGAYRVLARWGALGEAIESSALVDLRVVR